MTTEEFEMKQPDSALKTEQISEDEKKSKEVVYYLDRDNQQKHVKKWDKVQVSTSDDWSSIDVKEVSANRRRILKCKSLDNFKVTEASRHDLPTDLIKSRLCHGEIWGKFDLTRGTTKILIILSKRSRAFILTQRLRGFLIDHHNCGASWIYDFQNSASTSDLFTGPYCTRTEVKEAKHQLSKFSKFEGKDALLKNRFPSMYVAQLQSMRKIKEVEALYDGKVTPTNMRWYV